MTTGRHRSWFAAVLLLIGATACTETNEFLVPIGVTQLRMLDGDLAIQSITDPDGTIQAVDWTISAATLTIDGEVVDLLFDDPDCVFADTAYFPPKAEGRCDTGTILGSNEETPISATVEVTFTMVVSRAEPFDVAADPTGDFEGDGVQNAADICPFAYDPSQEDLDGNDLGDACSTVDPGTGVILADADGDGWEDLFDNCIWYPNPDQADADGDGIGDRCPEQSAKIIDSATGNAVIVIEDTVEFTQLRNQFNFLIVDFNSSSSVSNCVWSETSEGHCELNTAPIDFCVRSYIGSCPSD